MIIKKNKTTLSPDEVILILFAYFILSHFIIILNHIPITILTNSTPFTFLISLPLLTGAFLTILNRINLNKFFVFIAYRLVFKISIFALALAVLISAAFITANTSPDPFSTLIPIALFLSLALIGLLHTLKSAHQFEIAISEKHQNMRKILTLLNLKAKDAQTTQELQDMIQATIELMGVKVAKPTPKLEENELDFEAFINTHIESLKLNYQASAEIRTNIRYFEAHKKINAMNINYMISTLLENAFETETTHPIMIDILSSENILLIKVANETSEKTPQALENMLIKGYSTKGTVGRGFGLLKLKKLVEKQGGTMTISQEINTYEQVNYISFTLNF